MRIDVDEGIEIHYPIWSMYRGSRCIGDVKLSGRCFVCLRDEELFPARDPQSGETVFVCLWCL